MKVLFIGSGCACRLPFAESIFKKKLMEADVTGVEVEALNVAEWGVSIPAHEGDVCDTTANEVLNNADVIVVMEEKQRDFLTKFMDYSCWNKIHLFLDYCKRKVGVVDNLTGDLPYRTGNEEVNDGCQKFIDWLKSFIKEHIVSTENDAMIATV